MSITGVILTKNEEDNIEDCIRSIDFCDEIIVIDDFSTDRTVKIARQLNAKIFRRSLDYNFAAQRNFSLDKAKSKWVLFVDADERVSPNLADEINKIINSNVAFSGFYIGRADFFLGRKLIYGETRQVKLLRLAKRTSGHWIRRVHETWVITGKVGLFQNSILHYSHKSLSKIVQSINLWSKIHAKSNREEGKRSSLAKIIFMPIFKFIGNYILKLGFLDGTHGLVFALMMSFHSYLAWSTQWLLQKNSR